MFGSRVRVVLSLRVLPDVNECDDGIDQCIDNSECRNTIGGHTCKCRKGYEGDAKKLCAGTFCRAGEFRFINSEV